MNRRIFTNRKLKGQDRFLTHRVKFEIISPGGKLFQPMMSYLKRFALLFTSRTFQL